VEELTITKHNRSTGTGNRDDTSGQGSTSISMKNFEKIFNMSPAPWIDTK